MIELRILGATDLRRDGIDIRSVLSQPKRLALLVYLRLAAPGGFVARDRLLALFWPESDDERARNALRQSLHFLRRSLGEDVVVSRGEQEVGIDPSRLACDAVAVEEALARGRLDEALQLYRGDLLPGFHVEDAPGLERWIEEKRAELSRQAIDAARALAEKEAARGAVSAAVVWAGRHVALDPLSESATRRFMELLASAGERARALEAYDELVRRLERELELTPSAETAALAVRIRHGVPGEAAASQPDVAAPPVTGARAATGSEAARPPAPVPGRLPPSAARPDRSRRPLVAVAALVGAAILVALGALVPSMLRRAGTGPTVEAPSIAVMPFLDISEDGGREFFSEGMAEELLNVLARVPGLRVAARTSSFAYRDTQATADSIGRALRVSHLLEGSVRTEGDQVRVTVQLIETRDGFHLWSQAYDRRIEDIFRLQEEISRQVVDRLSLDLATPAALPAVAPPADPRAHELYLRGRHAANRRTESSIRSAIDYFEQAIQLDSGNTRAWAGMAEALLLYPQYAGTQRDPWYERAEAAAEHALRLDSTLAEVHTALGLRFYDTDPQRSQRHLERAIQLNPNFAPAHQWRASRLAAQGRYQEQLDALRRARAIDPLSPVIQLNEGKALVNLRRFDEAIATYRETLALDPAYPYAHAALAEALAHTGHAREATAAAERARELFADELHPQGLAAIGYALARAGQHQEARRIAQRLEELAAVPDLRPGPWGPAQVYAGLGDTDRALYWLDRAAAAGPRGGRPDLPWFDRLLGQPRYQDILREFGDS